MDKDFTPSSYAHLNSWWMVILFYFRGNCGNKSNMIYQYPFKIPKTSELHSKWLLLFIRKRGGVPEIDYVLNLFEIFQYRNLSILISFLFLFFNCLVCFLFLIPYIFQRVKMFLEILSLCFDLFDICISFFIGLFYFILKFIFFYWIFFHKFIQ